MAINGLMRLVRQLDEVAATTVYNGPKACAERVVRELQQAGPSWSGQFSNSWEISTPTRTTSGDGGPGEPRPVYTPPITGREAATSFLSRNSVVFRIGNTSPHALEAIDAVEHGREYWSRRRSAQPETQLGRRKWEVSPETRQNASYRGQLGGAGEGNSTRTAPLDWFATYANANLGRAVQIEMDAAMSRLQ